MKYFLLAFCFVLTAHAINCMIDPSDRLDCGFFGITQDQCQKNNCCWDPVNPNPSNIPWCFHNGESSCNFNITVSGEAPFSIDEVEKMRSYYLANIDIQNSGAVVASPDTTTPGGSYYFHWARDGALSMNALMYTTPSLSTIDNHMKNYCSWVIKIQNTVDPNNLDIRTEPKFSIPDGVPYTRPWCRPQNDGPALRAITLMNYANELLKTGQSAYVKKILWTSNPQLYHGGAIKFDLDYILNGWNSDTCDLWEELRSSDFFWNRLFFVKALQMGAAFAKNQGDLNSASAYTNLANTINQSIPSHYNGEFIFEEANRQKDAAVIVALNDGYNGGYYHPNSEEVANTIQEYNQLFCSTFLVNQNDNERGVPGILYGRYEGDTYAGGNPWILTTAALARLFYRAASQTIAEQTIPESKSSKWFSLLKLDSSGDISPETFASSMKDAGDAVLFRLRYHIAGDDFHLAEQLDRNTGVTTSATDLTWSYAEILKAMTARSELEALMSGDNILSSVNNHY